MRYAIVVHKDADSDYGVVVPDLPGCFSAGATMDEALENAREAIECHIEGLLEDGDPIPPRCGIEEHRRNPEFEGGIWAVVETDLSKLQGKVRRVNITVPERLLQRIDDAARRAGETRSGFMTRAALEQSDRPEAPAT
jgi:predicted RNase H-like HicB family nuclease